MTAVASLHHLHAHHHRRLYYATLNRRVLANNQSDNNNNNSNSRLSRSIVTSSIPPSADVFIERPEIIVLTESTALYTNSWDKVCKQYFTNCGMHYAHLDIFRQHPQQRQRLLSSQISKKEKKNDTRGDDNVLHAPVMSLENLEMTLTYDLSRLGTETSPDEHFNNLDDSSSGRTTSAHVVLIARGPIQCLVAQYFLESSPLAGLVLIDPLLLPEEDGRRKSTTSSSESRWTTSLMDLISSIEHVNPPPKNNEEIAFLHALLQQQQQASSSRPLQLEAGAVPMLILYSDNNDTTAYYRETFRICAERTGAYHTFNANHYDHQVVPVIKIPKNKNDDNDDDLQSTMRLIYEWYDEIVA